MPDNRSPESRSALMARIGSKNTAPEIMVRRLLHRLGYRFRLHRKDLPGSPDIVLPGRRKAIFVHGCFWHAHSCKIGRPPKSRPEFWLPKLTRNRQRDAKNQENLSAAGWSILTIWQCETREAELLKLKLVDFLEEPVKSDRFLCSERLSLPESGTYGAKNR
jgi:DNA mismatch endonuclease, patch repair protein